MSKYFSNYIKKSYETTPTVAARPKGTGIRFSDTISIATPIDSNHHILRNGLVRMHTQYKNTCGKVRSIYPSLVWHATEKMNKNSNCKGGKNSKENQYCQHCRVSEHKRIQQ